jgi:hypothetical protein
MDVEEPVRRAWEAVQKAEIPEPLQEVAFKEAVDYLRSERDRELEDEDPLLLAAKSSKKR